MALLSDLPRQLALLRASERHRYYEWFRGPGELSEYEQYLLSTIDRRE